MSDGPRKVLILCAVESGLDILSELVRLDFLPLAIVGLNPEKIRPSEVSGSIDVASAADSLGVPFIYANSYSLEDPQDKENIEKLDPDLVVILGWQRLVPDWLIELPEFGILGGHGSPDGIHGGRGRSPQNWAIMLGCQTFSLSLFRITSRVDEGPVLATRTFFYTPKDDIRVSYYRASLLMAEMIYEVLADPIKLSGGIPQPVHGYYYPQRTPEDGWVDWTLCASEIEAHCRALSKPYPGLRTAHNGNLIHLWKCQHFDDRIESKPGDIGPCFKTGEFLVNCKNGRLLIRDWSSENNLWQPKPSLCLEERKWSAQVQNIVERHQKKYPDYPVSPRIMRHIESQDLS
jgi:UDP-4-amino-4-deoxy-L-arabinose formyltransferase/UDP-glucuronic acid dehydrogenase (UDP-4-keto-hexauronic acid decarboxylating)